MSDKEILEVLKEMLADYEAVLIDKSDDESEVFNMSLATKNLDYGFCKWLKSSIYLEHEKIILNELGKDSEKSPTKDRINFFYPTVSNYKNPVNIKRYVLFPRANNIQRTIERIEKRILENITVTLPQQI